MIDVKPLIEPIGGVYRFVAKLAYCYESLAGGPEKSVDPGIGEVWGQTEDDARQKLKSKMEAWISDRDRC